MFFENGILDIGLLSDHVDISKYEFVRLPQKERWGIISHKDFKTSQKSSVIPNDLTQLPLIMPHRRLVQEEIKNWFGDLYDKINVFAVYNLLYNAAIMASKKMGVILSIELESKFKDLKFVPLAPPLEFDPVLVWKKKQIQSSVSLAFVDFAKDYIKTITAF